MYWFSFTPLVWLASWGNVRWHLTSHNPTDFSDSKHWQASHCLAIRPEVWSVVWLLTHPDFSQGFDPWCLRRWTWGMWKMSKVKSSSAGSPPRSYQLNFEFLPCNGWSYKLLFGAPPLSLKVQHGTSCSLSHVRLQSDFEGLITVMCSLLWRLNSSGCLHQRHKDVS